MVTPKPAAAPKDAGDKEEKKKELESSSDEIGNDDFDIYSIGNFIVRFGICLFIISLGDINEII